jgi:hypothetical protein
MRDVTAGIAKMRGTIGVAGVAVVLLAGCAVTGDGSEPGRPVTTPSPAHSSVDPNALPAIGYTRTGGIVGFQDSLRITPDGQVTASTRRYNEKHGSLTAAERTELLAAITKVPMTRISSTRTAEIPDGFHYVIVVSGRSARFSDPSVPPTVAAAVSVLNRIVSRVAG